MFQVGGVEVYVHKYIGPSDPSDPSKALGETTIQDVLFLENRDRKYDQDVYTIRGHYQTADVDFNLSQFGLFLQNDTIFMTVHINNSVDLLGRKILPGDVFEIPNLKDEHALNDFKSALKRFYVVEDINRAAEGFSATWYPHLYRIKLKPIIDSQEFKDILDKPVDTDSYAGDYDPDKTFYPGQVVKYLGTLYEAVLETSGVSPPDPSFWKLYNENSIRDILSTYEKEMQINDAIIAEAESDAPLSGYETAHFFTRAIDPLTGKLAINTVDNTVDNIATSLDISDVMSPPIRDGYMGYLLEDGIPPNGPISGINSQFGFGISFPRSPVTGDTFLRTDYLPNRLFRFDGVRWIKQEDNLRMTMTNTDNRQTLKTSFINNDETSGINRLAQDVIKVDLMGNPIFSAGNTTVDFYLTSQGAFVLTNIDYDPTFKVEVWVDESSKAKTSTSNSSGKLAFSINDSIRDGQRLRYTIYDKVVEQRQPVSKALRRIRPEVDE
jgi:hypothetical protein